MFGKLKLLIIACLFASAAAHAAEPAWLDIKPGSGPGKGKHIVFITGDEEYRSEESMPAMAKILAQRHGFQCTVLFSINPATGEIDPKVSDNIPGLDALRTADLMVVFTRFRHLPEEQMAKFVAYVESGKPVMGLRTATHAFDYDKFQKETYARWAWRGPDKNFQGGFGRQVLGETWVDHYGGYRSESTMGMVPPGMKDTEFYENILGWRTPWRVEAVTLDPATKAVEVKVKYEEGTLWASEAGERLPVYDHVERCWRHLDTCGFETRLRCRVPRVQTPAGKVETVPVPWAEEAEGTREVGGLASRAAQPLYAALRALCHPRCCWPAAASVRRRS